MAYQITQKANEDLLKIWLYIATESYSDYADNIFDRLLSQFDLISQNPDMGATRDELGKGIKLFPVDKINIVYTKIEGVVHIVRVIHSSRDARFLELK